MESTLDTKLTSKKLVIEGRLDGLNDYTKACRSRAVYGNVMKKRNEEIITGYIMQQLKGIRFEGRTYLHFRWIEPNKNRDLDNVCFAKKFILDALVRSGVIETDGWRGLAGFTDEFEVDPANPRIEVYIEGRIKDD